MSGVVIVAVSGAGVTNTMNVPDTSSWLSADALNCTMKLPTSVYPDGMVDVHSFVPTRYWYEIGWLFLGSLFVVQTSELVSTGSPV